MGICEELLRLAAKGIDLLYGLIVCLRYAVELAQVQPLGEN
jgi:hypothetical protein